MRKEKEIAGKSEWMKIAELCKASGFSKPVIMHYLKLGLLPTPLKISSNLHLYDRSHLDTLAKIALFRAEGLSLPQVKEALESGREPKPVPPPMPMGPDANGDKGQKITEMAIRLFSKNGYENVKVSDITDALNIGKGTFYLYFANKRELLHQCFEQVQSLLAASEQAPEIQGAPDIVSRMTNRWSYTQTYYPHFVGIVQMLQTTANSPEPEVRAMAIKSFDRIISAIREDLRRSQEEGVLAPLDPELLAHSLLGMMEAVSFRMSHDSVYTMEKATAAVAELMKRVLAPRS